MQTSPITCRRPWGSPRMDGRIRYRCGRASEKPSPMGQNFCMPAFKSLDLTLQFRLLPAFHTRPVCALGTLSPGEGLCQSPSHLLILCKCQPPLHKGAFCVFLKHKHTAAVSSGGQTVKKVVSFRASVHTGVGIPRIFGFFLYKNRHFALFRRLPRQAAPSSQ